MNLTVRVNTVRTQNPKGFGGCIFTAREIDVLTGVERHADRYLVVNASYKAIAGAFVEVGQWWQLECGAPETFSRNINGYVIHESQVRPTSALMLHPSGEHIIEFLARDRKNFPGIGNAKARQMWEHCRHEDGGLFGVLDRGDLQRLCDVLPRHQAEKVIAGWAAHGDSKTLQWLQHHGFDHRIGRQVVKVYGRETIKKIEEDPYRLLAFMGTWSSVDLVAREKFGVTVDSPVRLQGAVEEALYKVFAAGHTQASRAMVTAHLRTLLGEQKQGPEWMHAVQEAIEKGLLNGAFVVSDSDTFHPVGAFTMEMSVAKAIAMRLAPDNGSELLPPARVNEVIREYEAAQGFDLNEEQRQSVHLANRNRFSVVNGGAGVGKTTVLLAMCRLFDEAGVEVKQVALAGKAAKKMRQATGRKSSTIASFLRSTDPADLQGPTVLIVDEASMVDIISMFRLCELLPPHVRLLMVGDGGQLMPVDPGLVFHVLIGNDAIPQQELKQTKRFAGAIAEVAVDVRHGRWMPLTSEPSATISLLQCSPEDIPRIVTELYLGDPENSQIISTRRGGNAGTNLINTYCQSQSTGEGEALKVWNDEHDQWEWTRFRLHDQVLCTRNRWDMGIQNGSMGRLVEIANPPERVKDPDGNDLGEAIGWIMWDDGERRPMFSDLLGDLELGYCVTVHKAQGSEWPTVIFPLVPSMRAGFIDRTMIYTAITRARKKVYLIGDTLAFKDAVERPELSRQRHVALPALLRRLLPN